MRLLRVALLCLLVLPGDALAWNALGHAVIADIARQELTPEARQQIVNTIRLHPRFGEDLMQRMPADATDEDRWIFQHASTWPDIARGMLVRAARTIRPGHPVWAGRRGIQLRDIGRQR